MSEIHSNLSSDDALQLNKKAVNGDKDSNQTSSVKKALNWLFLSEYKE